MHRAVDCFVTPYCGGCADTTLADESPESNFTADFWAPPSSLNSAVCGFSINLDVLWR